MSPTDFIIDFLFAITRCWIKLILSHCWWSGLFKDWDIYLFELLNGPQDNRHLGLPNPIQYTTISSSDLRKHITSKHAGEKSKICNQCNYTFTSSGELRSHMGTHTGENQCGYSFAHVATSQKHMRIHTVEEPHKCNQCNYRYLWRKTFPVEPLWKNFHWELYVVKSLSP